MKNLHKFFTKVVLPWVKLIWFKYYSNGKVPGDVIKGSFWWRSMLRMLNTYKGIAQAQLGLGDTILFWSDMWSERIIKLSYAQLHSFAINGKITVKAVMEQESLQDILHLKRLMSNSLNLT
jgi:hypothetical protein